MNNNFINIIIVACVATIGIFGFKNHFVEAQVSAEDRLAVIGVRAGTDTEHKNEASQIESSIPITNEEKDLFARLVEAEAKGEPYEGKVAVAEVVINRVESPEFPETVTGVVTQVVGDSYAFSPVQNGEIHKPASEEAKKAVDEALTSDESLNEATFFYNPEIATDDWIRSREVVKSIGDHVFAK